MWQLLSTSVQPPLDSLLWPAQEFSRPSSSATYHQMLQGGGKKFILQVHLTCVRARMRACVHACVHACVRGARALVVGGGGQGATGGPGDSMHGAKSCEGHDIEQGSSTPCTIAHGRQSSASNPDKHTMHREHSMHSVRGPLARSPPQQVHQDGQSDNHSGEVQRGGVGDR
jgi:hypothetical protein